MRLGPAIPLSPVKHSTTEQQHSLCNGFRLVLEQFYMFYNSTRTLLMSLTYFLKGDIDFYGTKSIFVFPLASKSR